MNGQQTIVGEVNRGIPLWLFGYVIAICVLAIAAFWAAGFSTSAFLLIAITLALLVPLMFRTLRGAPDLFEPIVVANVALGVMFIGRPLSDLFMKMFDSLGYDIRPTFNETLAIALVGILCFQAGYFGPLRSVFVRYVPAPPPNFRPRRWLVSAWISAILGAALFWLFLSAGGGLSLFLFMLRGLQGGDSEFYLQSTGYFYLGPLLWMASAILFFALGLVRRMVRYHFYSFLISVGFLVLYGAQGARSHLLVPALALPVFWYLWKGRRPPVSRVLIFMLVGISLLGWLRETRVAGERGDVVAVLKTALISPVAEAARILTGPDAEMFDALADELRVVPERLPFQYGATATDLIVRAVPRPIWPNKPIEANSAVVNALWPERYSSSRSGPAFSLMGPLYADSGVPCVVIGMFVVGAFFGGLWEWFQRSRHLVNAQLLYCVTLPFVVILIRGTIADTAGRALFVVSPLLLAVAWGQRRRAVRES
jgi:hypothetical protein